MVKQNAQEVLEQQRIKWLSDSQKTQLALEEIQEALNLAAPPYRIECYDISNTQGTNSVGAMVVFEAGRPKNSEYRRFKIKTVEGPNDFASHQEMLRRRFRRHAGSDAIELLSLLFPLNPICPTAMPATNSARREAEPPSSGQSTSRSRPCSTIGLCPI